MSSENKNKKATRSSKRPVVFSPNKAKIESTKSEVRDSAPTLTAKTDSSLSVRTEKDRRMEVKRPKLGGSPKPWEGQRKKKTELLDRNPIPAQAWRFAELWQKEVGVSALAGSSVLTNDVRSVADVVDSNARTLQAFQGGQMECVGERVCSFLVSPLASTLSTLWNSLC